MEYNKEIIHYNSVIQKMIEIYGYNCWMNGIITKNNKLTIHHIVPIRVKRIKNISNFALLTNNSHALFNYIELNYEKYGLYLTELFTELNHSNCPPTKEYVDEIKLILSKVKIDK